MTLALTGLVSRDPHQIAANPGRVITRLFVPGQEGFELQESRAGVVLKRILALTDDDVLSSLDDVIIRFDGRHRDLVGTFRRHAHELADRLNPDITARPMREYCCWAQPLPASTPSKGRRCATPALWPTPTRPTARRAACVS